MKKKTGVIIVTAVAAAVIAAVVIGAQISKSKSGTTAAVSATQQAQNKTDANKTDANKAANGDSSADTSKSGSGNTSSNSTSQGGTDKKDNTSGNTSGGNSSSTKEEAKKVTPTFMYFISASDTDFAGTNAKIDALKKEYDGKVNFDIVNVDENPDAKKNFPVDGQTPALIMLNTSNDICAIDMKCADESKLKADIEKALNG